MVAPPERLVRVPTKTKIPAEYWMRGEIEITRIYTANDVPSCTHIFRNYDDEKIYQELEVNKEQCLKEWKSAFLRRFLDFKYWDRRVKIREV